jgi:ATP-binding cassette subfamily F protein uup
VLCEPLEGTAGGEGAGGEARLQEIAAGRRFPVEHLAGDEHARPRAQHQVIVAEGEGKWTEYAGGYTDMVTQRGFGVRALDAPAPKSKAGRTAHLAPMVPPTPKGKLSFKQKHALETLPKEMARLRAEIGKHNATLADAGLYARDAKAFADKSARLAAVQGELAAAEERWLELEMLREEIEGA